MDGIAAKLANGATLTSHTMLMVVFCCSECCVPSELGTSKAGGFVVCYRSSSISANLWAIETYMLVCGKMWKHLKECPSPSLAGL